MIRFKTKIKTIGCVATALLAIVTLCASSNASSLEPIQNSSPAIKCDLFSLSCNNVEEDASEKEAYKNFSNFYENYNDWCNNSDKLSIDVKHSIRSEDVSSVFTETHTQLDNVSNFAHIVTYKPTYMLDMWCDISNNDYHVSIVSEDDSTTWVNAAESYNVDLKNFITNNISYRKSLSTVEDVLKFINSFVVLGSEESLTITPIDNLNGYVVEYYSDNSVDLNALPTFMKPSNLDNWSICFSKLKDDVYITINYNYSENSSIQSESYDYHISTEDNCYVDLPAVIFEKEDTVEHLEEIYMNIKGE